MRDNRESICHFSAVCPKGLSNYLRLQPRTQAVKPQKNHASVDASESKHQLAKVFVFRYEQRLLIVCLV